MKYEPAQIDPACVHRVEKITSTLLLKLILEQDEQLSALRFAVRLQWLVMAVMISGSLVIAKFVGMF